MTIEKVPTVDTLTKIERRHRRRMMNDAYKWLCHRDENIAVIVWRQQLSVKLQPQSFRNLSIIYTLLKPGRFPVQYAYTNEPILHRRGFYDFWTSTDRLSIILKLLSQYVCKIDRWTINTHFCQCSCSLSKRIRN